MAWIKRNLYFVISLAVGLVLAGVAGYFVYTAIGANTEARDQYTGALNDLTTLEQKKPYPSKENIEVATRDSERVAQLVKALGSSFVNFPPPPNVDAREFLDFLNTNLSQFRAMATNANVELTSPDYAFSFQGQVNALAFPNANFSGWMEQLAEIKAIVGILCEAKINSLDILQRAPVGGEDPNGPDYLPGAITSNQVAIISPYKVAFHGFSEEVANVLRGFAGSSHCFLIKDLEVSPTSGPGYVPPAQMNQPTMYMQYPNPYQGGGYPGGEGGRFRRRQGFTPPPPMMVAVPAPTTPSGPVTIIKPMPLFVTMLVEVVRLKNSQR